MKGYPKYKIGDIVTFELDSLNKVTGEIYIVDAYGTFEDPSEVSYDIMSRSEKYKSEMNPTGECLYKHIREDFIIS